MPSTLLLKQQKSKYQSISLPYPRLPTPFVLWKVEGGSVEQVEEKAGDGDHNHSQYNILHQATILPDRTLQPLLFGLICRLVLVSLLLLLL
jgi:hypothetical protein